MRDHYDDLRVIQRHLVEGDLDTVRDYAFSIAVDRPDPELAAWSGHLARMRAAAEALGMATGVGEAARREPLLAAVCGACHRETGTTADLEIAPLPPNDATALARMDRHQWAADRLWQALVMSSDRAWRDGLDVLAETPLPTIELITVAAPDAAPSIEQLGKRLQRMARRARSVGALERRAVEYGEILVVCASCHELAR
jgi:cytochrome c553